MNTTSATYTISGLRVTKWPDLIFNCHPFLLLLLPLWVLLQVGAVMLPGFSRVCREPDLYCDPGCVVLKILCLEELKGTHDDTPHDRL